MGVPNSPTPLCNLRRGSTPTHPCVPCTHSSTRAPSNSRPAHGSTSRMRVLAPAHSATHTHVRACLRMTPMPTARCAGPLTAQALTPVHLRTNTCTPGIHACACPTLHIRLPNLARPPMRGPTRATCAHWCAASTSCPCTRMP